MLSSMMHCVGRGIATGVAIACCTPTAGAGTPGTDRPANKDMLCELKSTPRAMVYLMKTKWYNPTSAATTHRCKCMIFATTTMLHSIANCRNMRGLGKSKVVFR